MSVISGVTTIPRNFEVDEPFGFVFNLENGGSMSIKMDGSDWQAAADIKCSSFKGLKGAKVLGMELVVNEVVLQTDKGEYKFSLQGTKGRHFVVDMGDGKVVFGVL